MKELWNRILHKKFHIGWVFGFLIVCIILCMYALSRLIWTKHWRSYSYWVRYYSLFLVVEWFTLISNDWLLWQTRHDLRRMWSHIRSETWNGSRIHPTILCILCGRDTPERRTYRLRSRTIIELTNQQKLL